MTGTLHCDVVAVTSSPFSVNRLELALVTARDFFFAGRYGQARKFLVR